jgi:hypothetical protein
MLFKTILDALETVIRESGANTHIRLYRRYAIEQGVHSMPTLVLGTTLNFKVTETFLGEDAVSHPQLIEATIGMCILNRNYPLPAQVVRAAEATDVCQHAVCDAILTDSTQGEKVAQSWITNVREITIPPEYKGFEINIICQVFESGV